MYSNGSLPLAFIGLRRLQFQTLRKEWTVLFVWNVADGA